MSAGWPDMSGMFTHIREALPATNIGTFVGFVASVSAPMDRQCTALDKGLLARLVVACVRPLICMDAVMPLQVGLAVETLRSDVSESILEGLSAIVGLRKYLWTSFMPLALKWSGRRTRSTHPTLDG